ncbi:hypothetical protein HUG10_20635 (plasmid) [Halorarum halophilum]|uniref:Uncharacterized protein n=1 Tax=Halorarum halophilum TaxID=2743090 RepID=A0A7D5KIH0_9EURY|nr:hypothetical protein [Halobaculum halophilum]QLG30016.1 hypothetical protein HUG10_20635 [Halobaculum halophilum]
MDRVLDRIREVWGDYDDFERGGFEYVEFLIRCDLDDIRQDDYDREESIEELADIASNAIRAIDELGETDPESAILDRLATRHYGEQAEIIEQYQERYVAAGNTLE